MNAGTCVDNDAVQIACRQSRRLVALPHEPSVRVNWSGLARFFQEVP